MVPIAYGEIVQTVVIGGKSWVVMTLSDGGADCRQLMLVLLDDD